MRRLIRSAASPNLPAWSQCSKIPVSLGAQSTSHRSTKQQVPPLSRPHILVGWVVRDDGNTSAAARPLYSRTRLTGTNEAAYGSKPQHSCIVTVQQIPVSLGAHSTSHRSTKQQVPPLSRPHILVGWVVRDDGKHALACTRTDGTRVTSSPPDMSHIT